MNRTLEPFHVPQGPPDPKEIARKKALLKKWVNERARTLDRFTKRKPKVAPDPDLPEFKE
jgi:hypothetical protein